MTDINALVARLRNYKWVVDENPCPEAADLIEALSGEVDSLKLFYGEIKAERDALRAQLAPSGEVQP